MTEMIWNWDNKLRTAAAGDKSIAVKYDPDGNRIYKESSDGSTTIKRKFIVGVIGALSVILAEINPANSQLVKSYIYANDQVIAQHDGDYSADKYFYLHDRLGSVRQIIDDNADVVNRYTYNPFGEDFPAETEETIANPFQFTGQYYDQEINQYYLRARQYDPYISRFTTIDPVNGNFNEPLTLHQYLYCLNDPLNRTDLTGEFSLCDITITSAIKFGLRVWGAYSTYSRAKGYASMVTSGASLRNVFMTVAIDATIDYGGGKIFGLAAKGLGLVGKKIVKKSADIIEQHHVIPKLLTGKDDGMLVGIARKIHRGQGPDSYHNILKQKLKDKFGDDLPGWSTKDWEKLFRDNPKKRELAAEALMEAAEEFDNLYGGDILSTATDFELRNLGWK